MESWIYIFSQFTPEALVLELSLIFILCGGYAVFWILRKRKFGVANKVIPSGPVKAYLTELIGHADLLKTQLFGIMATDDPENARGSDFGRILANLDAKLDAQGKAIADLSANGVPMMAGQQAPEVAAPVAAVGPRIGGATSDAEVATLKDKVEHLETRLAEYSIIEDDLANLKRIQQENNELRASLKALNGGANPGPVTVASARSAAAAAALAADEAAAIPITAAAAEPAFQLPSHEAAPLASTPEPALDATSGSDPSTRVPEQAEEDDLVKEFEKMLQG